MRQIRRGRSRGRGRLLVATAAARGFLPATDRGSLARKRSDLSLQLTSQASLAEFAAALCDGVGLPTIPGAACRASIALCEWLAAELEMLGVAVGANSRILRRFGLRPAQATNRARGSPCAATRRAGNVKIHVSGGVAP